MRTKEELKKYMIDSYKDIFGDQYDEKRAIASYERILAENEDLEKAAEAAQSIVERTRNRVEQSKMARENLAEIKEGLHDAPSEVKEAFNTIVGYFDNKCYVYVNSTETEVVYQIGGSLPSMVSEVWEGEYMPGGPMEKTDYHHIGNPKAVGAIEKRLKKYPNARYIKR